MLRLLTCACRSSSRLGPSCPKSYRIRPKTRSDLLQICAEGSAGACQAPLGWRLLSEAAGKRGLTPNLAKQRGLLNIFANPAGRLPGPVIAAAHPDRWLPESTHAHAALSTSASAGAFGSSFDGSATSEDETAYPHDEYETAFGGVPLPRVGEKLATAGPGSGTRRGDGGIKPGFRQCDDCRQDYTLRQFREHRRGRLWPVCRGCESIARRLRNHIPMRTSQAVIRERFHRCSRCHETLARSFYVLHKPTGGYAGVCKQCQEENRKARAARKQPAVAADSKCCRMCTLSLPVSMFAKRKYNDDGLNAYCRGCEELLRVQNKARVELAAPLAAKRCAECAIVKPHSAFNVNRSIKGGRSSRCRQCINMAKRAQRSKDAVLRAQAKQKIQ